MTMLVPMEIAVYEEYLLYSYLVLGLAPEGRQKLASLARKLAGSGRISGCGKMLVGSARM